MDFARVMQNIEPEYAVPQKTPFAKVKEQETAFQFPEKKISEPYQILLQQKEKHWNNLRKNTLEMQENLFLQ